MELLLLDENPSILYLHYFVLSLRFHAVNWYATSKIETNVTVRKSGYQLLLVDQLTADKQLIEHARHVT